jgi:hypothetical protein
MPPSTDLPSFVAGASDTSVPSGTSMQSHVGPFTASFLFLGGIEREDAAPGHKGFALSKSAAAATFRAATLRIAPAVR